MSPPPRRRSMLVSRLSAAPAGPATPHDAILDELRRVIVDGGAPPGTPIPAGDVAELFGVSAIPVREALKTLVGERLVEHRHGAGYVVARLTRAELTELYTVRGVLESAALRVAVDTATAQDVARADAAHHALEDSIVAADPRAYHRESRRFHLALIAASRMHRLVHMVESAWNLTEPFQPMSHVDPHARLQLHADHERMLEAFRSRDTEQLLATSQEHHQRLETVIAGLPASSGLRPER